MLDLQKRFKLGTIKRLVHQVGVEDTVGNKSVALEEFPFHLRMPGDHGTPGGGDGGPRVARGSHLRGGSFGDPPAGPRPSGQRGDLPSLPGPGGGKPPGLLPPGERSSRHHRHGKPRAGGGERRPPWRKGRRSGRRRSSEGPRGEGIRAACGRPVSFRKGERLETPGLALAGLLWTVCAAWGAQDPVASMDRVLGRLEGEMEAQRKAFRIPGWRWRWCRTERSCSPRGTGCAAGEERSP
jgi:hypothetical protein